MNKKCKEILKELESKNKIKVWWNFKFPEKEELQIRLKDILENNVEEKYFLKNAQLEKIKKTNYESSKFENRARDENGIAPTLCTRDYKDPKCVQIGTLDMKGIDQLKRVYSPKGLSPTLTTMGGGNREPKISVCAAMRGRYDKNGQIQQNLEIQKNETTNSITTVSKDNLIIESSVKPSVAKNFETDVCPTLDTQFSNSWRGVILEREKLYVKNATKKGYLEATIGDSINLAYSNSKTRRGRVGKQVSQTLQCNDNMGVVVTNELRIRKLTPRECWRLMGFTDDEFDRAAKVNSNSQLYKQAGNSIVVNVLVEIFRNLFPDECQNK